MNEIRTYNDLLQEKKRLKASLAIHKELIHQDLIDLKEKFQPALNLFSRVKRITKRNKTHPLLALGVNVAGEIFLRKLFSKSHKIVRLTVPFIAKKAVNSVLMKGVVNLLSKV